MVLSYLLYTLLYSTCTISISGQKVTEMPSLQGQKPSNMLAKMRQLCPAGEDKTTLFCWVFLRRLSDMVKLMLSEDHSS